MLNRVVLVGRLTRDPDLRYTPNGVAVANFNIAVNRPFSNQQGEREADFINGVVWRRQAENLANFMKKGSLIGVDGRLQTRTYEGQDGKTVYVTEVVADSIQFLESKMLPKIEEVVHQDTSRTRTNFKASLVDKASSNQTRIKIRVRVRVNQRKIHSVIMENRLTFRMMTCHSNRG